MSTQAAFRRGRRDLCIARAALCVVAWVGCSAEAPTHSRAPRDDTSSHAPEQPLQPDANQDTQPSLCDRARVDEVRDIFCAPTPPAIRGLRDLQDLLRLSPPAPPVVAADRPPPPSFAADTLARSATTFSVLGHSTALSGRLVSPINPRAIILGTNTAMTFQRGIQRIELITRDRNTDRLNFYLLSFEQACSQRAQGCSPGDLYTPRIESAWTAVELRDDEDLKNTSSDCRQCHQRGRETPTLLMRELESPWTHFFEPIFEGDSIGALPGVRGRDLMADYLQAKGDELYGGFEIQTVTGIAPFLLQTTVPPLQPLLFDAPRIYDERYPYGPDGYASDPSPSPTWDAGYEAFKRGEQLALPYFEQRVSDVGKQAKLSEAYARYRSGEISADELPDMADIFPDDPHVRAQIGLQTEPDATPVEALIQACGSCHNDVLDQSISRARFSIDLSRLDRSELDLAIERIQRPRAAPGAMPPPEARQLDAETRERLLAYLRQDLREADVDPLLQRAAELGMSGGAPDAGALQP
jgi:hypothetical protein